MKHVIAVIFFILSFHVFAQTSDSLNIVSIPQKFANLVEKYDKDPNPEKSYAARFLISNMRYHQLGGIINYYDPKIDAVIHDNDTHYYHLIKGSSAKEQESEPLHSVLKEWALSAANLNEAKTYQDLEVQVTIENDTSGIDVHFIERQIEYAFGLRESIPQIKAMPLTDFCAYILPYRAIFDYPLVSGAEDLATIFYKYLTAPDINTADEIAAAYNRTLWWFRKSGGKYPYDSMMGWKELFFAKFHDCVDIANYATCIFRSCGIPSAVEYNAARRFGVGRHFMTGFMDKYGNWATFSPEAELPSKKGNKYVNSLNIYRDHFEGLSSSPFCIKSDSEQIPDFFSNPGMEDITSKYLTTASLQIPITDSITSGNNLAYLAVFSPYPPGITPVTWGRIEADSVAFKNIVPNELYFPVFFTEGKEYRPFSPPFCIESSLEEDSIFTITPIVQTADTVSLYVTRKHPPRPSFARDARNTAGTVVLGCMSKDFHNADTLAVFPEGLDDRWHVLDFEPKQAYSFYRIQTPPEDPHIHLAEIQFYNDSVRVFDEPLEKCRWKKEYDGKVTTAPEKWPNVTLSLPYPQIVNNIHYVVKNDDAGIKIGHCYSVNEWTKEGWKIIANHQVIEDRLYLNNVVSGKLYWIHDITVPDENELPFTIDSNGQYNPYLSIMKTYNL